MAEADYRLMTEATGQRIAAALEALSLGAVSWSDVVNNLTATEKSVLDARQGKALKDLIDGMVSGVKGNAEGAYRHGDVNITPADIGAVNTNDVIDILHGGTGATTAAVTIANDYSSVLNAISAVRSTRIFPISIQKYGTSSYSDMPSGQEQAEWNMELVGEKGRLTAFMFLYGQAAVYKRHVFNDSWLGSWQQIAPITPADIGAMSRSPVSIYGSDSGSLSNDIQSAVFNIPVNTGTLVYFYYAGSSDNVLTYGATYSGIIHRFSEDGYFFTGSFTNNVGQMITIYRSGSGGLVSYKRVI